MVRPTKSSDEKQPYSFVQPEEWDCIFLHVSRSGSLASAIRESIGERRAPAIYAALRASLDLTARLRSSESEFRDGLLAELVRRGRDGVDTPKFDKDGAVIAYVKSYSDNALLAACRHFLGEHGWVDKRSVGDVSHHHSIEESPGAVALLSVDDLQHLNEIERRSLAQILGRIKRGRNEASAAERELAAITDQSGAVDAEFAEVESDDRYSMHDLAEVFAK
jgi:hypothetical protein